MEMSRIIWFYGIVCSYKKCNLYTIRLKGMIIMALFDNTSFNLLEKSLDATWLKQKVTLQNIANDSTPNYKAKTVEFGTILKEKCKCKYHISDPQDPFENSDSNIDLTARITEETGTTQTLDGNNVDMEKEQVALSDAQYQYSALLDKVNGEFSMMKSAIQK